MTASNRRAFLADVGRGMMIGTLGAGLAVDMGLSNEAFAADDGARLTFGEIEPLVDLMQNTPPEKLMQAAVKKIEGGASLKTLTAAAALANARRFGGQDYVGYHTFMALAPAYEMSQQLPANQAPLPVLKVLYRNAARIQSSGGPRKERLKQVEPAKLAAGADRGKALQEATRSGDFGRAEAVFAAMKNDPAGEIFNHVQYSVRDSTNVHRVVLPWRAWAVLGLTGQQHAHTLLRMSVRFCTEHAKSRHSDFTSERSIAVQLPRLLSQYKLLDRPAGTRRMDEAWLMKMATLIYSGSREKAADAIAAALADGVHPTDVGEAISLAANMLVLYDPGREKARPGKPVGSVHGDSRGVHASDAANAWRNIAKVADHRNKMATLVTAGFHTGGQSSGMNRDPHPLKEQLERIETTDAAKLLKQAEGAIRENNQASASALIHQYGEAGHNVRPALDLLLKFATSEDGALHAEKYYQTVFEEFAAARPAFRWRHIAALARVTASEFGNTAAGYRIAKDLLG